MRLLVTGGAGFIGSSLVSAALEQADWTVLVIDSFSYAGNAASLNDIGQRDRLRVAHLDIQDSSSVRAIVSEFRPNAVVHLAAETHVDRSIDNPLAVAKTNVQGTFALLEVIRNYWSGLDSDLQEDFRYIQMSTDEVFGSLSPEDSPFSTDTAYAPSSPYAASKASGDHFARAWHRTYGLPTIVVHASNNYGPRQFPEKLIPHMIISALREAPLPIYGDGSHIRDWLYVKDHANALLSILDRGVPGRTYLVGGSTQATNLEVVEMICGILDDLAASRRPSGLRSYVELVTYVEDRPGHDQRYAVDSTSTRTLGWAPHETLASGMTKTVEWYLGNPQWWEPILRGGYELKRLGL